MKKYTIGIDFGTLSGRALLLDVSNGSEIVTSTYEYPHGVMDSTLPSGKPLEYGWALQHPQDYVDVLKNTIPAILKESGVDPKDIISIAVDFTTSTVLPIRRDGTPLCFLDEFENEPHAYVKLWKHQSADFEAKRINEIAKERGDKWLRLYGGKVSPELMIPKIWEVLNANEHIYNEADLFIEACDWISWLLSGRFARSESFLALKAFWNKHTGFPSKDFFSALDPKLENIAKEKLAGNILPVCTALGKITRRMSDATGLSTDTLIVTGTGDAHAAIPAVKALKAGSTCAVLGTSAAFLTVSNTLVDVPGVLSIVEDSVAPGYYCYEAGQICVGDLFSWFIKSCVPESYIQAAIHEKKSIYDYLSNKAYTDAPGKSGLIALDWWNGNRSVLSDSDLSGMILGLKLSTRPEEIYRALIESTVFGAKKIFQTLSEHGVYNSELCVTGGICEKNPFMMQCYADVLNIPIHVSDTKNGSALGAAIIASVIGRERGGYDTLEQASEKLGSKNRKEYMPIAEHTKIYERLYREYVVLHDYFGKGTNDVMKRLKKLRTGL